MSDSPTPATPAATPDATATEGPPRRTRIALVFGGRSGEHAISCATAAGVLRALDRERYDVLPIGITPSGQWVLAPDDPDMLSIAGSDLPEVVSAAGDVVLPMATSDRELIVSEHGKLPRSLGEVDVVFPVLHGPYGEDGTLQGLLELAHLPYVGSGVLASAVGMDKHYMKVVLAGHGLPVGPYTVITPRLWRTDPEAATDAVESLGFPVFVKPARAGSSLGISKVESRQDLAAAVAEAQRHDPKVIVEAAIEGREIECAVLGGRGDQPARTALPGEIAVSGHDFYDFEAKYIDAAHVRLSCPAELPEDVIARVRELAAEAFEALGCEGLARVDFFVSPTGAVTVNEVNTMPGFTPFSMYPLMWERSGMSYAELVDELVQLALERPVGLR
ncbi:D-alanine--D-alanine ligase [Georgenia sp. 311]|uniref:D-alanine--D-alanine ligase n=1 Tax=Georgenia wutianyii TaxID=2585135 RepID=A0ABX5VMW2_9MICO|nr:MULTISPECIES: D-alanine--D-alanine ligase family protein [Georgenia]QDB79842.1 D-alanine--D-alanine ligase [Georgenia wutianyii]TNC18028.1 D-alanine--D-alanine ligase [Georgenia sp. 311]